MRFAVRPPTVNLLALTPPPPVFTGALAVGITGAAGTRITSMTPADLTQPGLVNIEDFRISLFAGVW